MEIAMSQAIMDQVVLWALTASIGGLALVIYSIGRHMIEEIENTKKGIALLRESIDRDLRVISERVAKLEGAVFPWDRKQ